MSVIRSGDELARLAEEHVFETGSRCFRLLSRSMQSHEAGGRAKFGLASSPTRCTKSLVLQRGTSRDDGCGEC